MLTAEQVGLTDEVISTLRHLNEIKITGNATEAIRDANVATLESAIPKCRISELRQTETEVGGVGFPKDVIATLSIASCSISCASE